MIKAVPAKDKSTQSSQTPVRRSLTPFKRLERRILREFTKKTFIGDISINETEYKLLIEYFRLKCKVLFNSYINTVKDPVFATAIVQIGIKYYDGRLWPHIADVLEVKTLNSNQRLCIGGSFIETLSSSNKLMLEKSQMVNNILMHGFVSDHYANEMFDFLFKFYNIDLERNLQRNNKEMMDSLIEVIRKNDNTGRTYLLVKQTADAIGVNVRGGKIRIRRLLRLIDRCFWEQITPANPISRISILFNKWQENSDEFKTQYNKYHSSSSRGGNKSFSSPYLNYCFDNTIFKLILPTQLIKFEYSENIKWKVIIGENQNIVNTYLYQAVTGNKTETVELNIKAEDIFNELVIELYCGDNRIKLFKTKADCIRFFDKDGNYLNSDNSIPRGEVYAFTKMNEIPKSEALIDIEPIGNLVKSSFEFEYGDIVRLPDGKPLSIGKKIEEGLLYRKILVGSHALSNEESIPIYCSPPSIMLKIQAKRANGTMIDINGNRYHLFDKETTVIDLKDRSGETGYIMNLGDYGCNEDGIYTIFVDVPNDRTNRFWRFALINGIRYEFEDAPYIFKTKGTIKFNDGLIVHPQENIEEKNIDENSYNFKIWPDIDNLHFKYAAERDIIDLYFDIPVFKWKFDSENWNVEKPLDIWHSRFPTMIYIKYPDERIVMTLDEDVDIGSNQEQRSVPYFKSKTKGMFDCDMTRFKSWFGREKVKRTLFVDFPKNRTEFINIITRSVVASQIIKGDFHSKRLIGEFNIIGFANYYADIMLDKTKQMIKEKIPIINGRFEFEDKLLSGLYKITIFEDEEDDTGFEIYNYLPIGEFTHDIINPYNLNGKNIALKFLRKSQKGSPEYRFRCRYVVCDLTKLDEKNDHKYKGKLMIKTPDGISPICFDVNVEFRDLNKLHHAYLSYFDGYDYIEFLYDSYQKIIVMEEEKGLSRAVKYRRYECVFDEEYIYEAEFTNDIPNSYAPADIINNETLGNRMIWKEMKNEMRIEQMDFSIRTYNCLRRAGIKTVEDIERIGTQALFKVRNLGKTNIEEIISKMSLFGYKINDIETKGTREEIPSTTNINNTFKTSLSQIGLSNLVLNCLKKSKIITVEDVVNLGLKKLGTVQGLNNKMRKELLDKLYTIGISIK